MFFSGQYLLPAMLWLGVLALFIGIAVFALRRLRERIDKDETAASEMLTNFREMHLQGGLSDAEFRTIKTVLGAKLQRDPKEKNDQAITPQKTVVQERQTRKD